MAERVTPASVMVSLDRSSAASLHRQLYGTLRQGILAARLDRLPLHPELVALGIG